MTAGGEAERTSLEALQSEVEFYRQNQTAVEQEIRILIQDNQKLSQQVGSLLKEKLENARNQDGDHTGNLEEVRRQVSMLAKERDSLHVLWQTSQKTIDALETELKTYQGYEGRGQQLNIIDERRDLELKLETSLADYIELEKKHKELQSKTSSLENELKSRETDFKITKENLKEVQIKFDELSKRNEELRIEHAVEKKSGGDLRSQLQMCQKECVNAVKKDAEAKSKVAEALQLYDLVAAQKEEAFKKIAEITRELEDSKQALANVKRQTEKSFRAELDDVKEKYNEKVSDMLNHIRNLDSELVQRGLLLNKTLREVKILQTENENYLKQQKVTLETIDPRLASAEQRIKAMFQELVKSERRNIKLVCEKQGITLDIQRMRDAHSREMKRREWEEKLLKTECTDLKMQVENLKKSLANTHEMVTKLQEILASRTTLNQKMVSTKEEELEELNKHLENQMELNKKWKESYIDMTEKLKKRLKDLYDENTRLRVQLNVPSSDRSCIDEDSVTS